MKQVKAIIKELIKFIPPWFSDVINHIIIKCFFPDLDVTLDSRLDIHKLNTYNFGKKVRLQSVLSSGGYLSVGDYSFIGQCNIASRKDAPVIIGKYCAIASGTSFISGNHPVDYPAVTYPLQAILNTKDAGEQYGHMANRKPITIGNDVWIGRGAIILKGVTVGDGAVIGAGAIVTKNVAPYSIVGGSPAKEIRKRFSDNKIKKLLDLKWWDWSEAEIIKNKNFFISKGNYFVSKK